MTKHAYEVYGSVLVRAESADEALTQAEAGEYDEIQWGKPAPKRRPEFDETDETEGRL